jgi:hypothetical protein
MLSVDVPSTGYPPKALISSSVLSLGGKDQPQTLSTPDPHNRIVIKVVRDRATNPINFS